ncbi:MAG: hypothetical protein AAF797_12300 [Planctomycetota bacterium]
MKLPPSIGPAWNLRLFRRVSLLMFVAMLAVVVSFLTIGYYKQAGVLTISAIFFGLFWQFVRHLTLQLEKWSQRPGFREVSPNHRLQLTGNTRE